MKKIFFACMALLIFSFIIPSMSPKSIYDFKVEALGGGTIDFSKFKGKKILIVNTASKCGYTPQYEGLRNYMKNIKINWW